jgi:6-phosphogluconolactonase
MGDTAEGIEASVHPDLEALSRAAAEAVTRAAERAVRERARFTISLAGGHTPRRLYELLAAEYHARIPWPVTYVFFGDERCVPPTDPASNYGMALESFLSRVPIPAEQVHRIRGELPPEDAAREYGRLLRRAFAPSAAGPGTDDPADAATFDVALLGMGTDGHTASLFPGDPALDERHHWAVAVEAPAYVAPPRERITLTLPALCGARDVYVLAAGAEKRPVVESMLGGEARATHARALSPASEYPVGLVRGRESTVWFVDRAAADGL